MVGYPEYAGNDLQYVAASMRPEIEDAVEALLGMGAPYAAMSGSGSCVFGVFLSDAKRD